MEQLHMLDMLELQIARFFRLRSELQEFTEANDMQELCVPVQLLKEITRINDEMENLLAILKRLELRDTIRPRSDGLQSAACVAHVQ